jgi:carboxyl-terminal processing protease
MDWIELPASDLQPRDGPRFLGPIVLLIGPATFSAAEDFLVAWKNSDRGKIIGEPSAGSTGQPLFFQLPGGRSARFAQSATLSPTARSGLARGSSLTS